MSNEIETKDESKASTKRRKMKRFPPEQQAMIYSRHRRGESIEVLAQVFETTSTRIAEIVAKTSDTDAWAQKHPMRIALDAALGEKSIVIYGYLHEAEIDSISNAAAYLCDLFYNKHRPGDTLWIDEDIVIPAYHKHRLSTRTVNAALYSLRGKAGILHFEKDERGLLKVLLPKGPSTADERAQKTVKRIAKTAGNAARVTTDERVQRLALDFSQQASEYFAIDVDEEVIYAKDIG